MDCSFVFSYIGAASSMSQFHRFAVYRYKSTSLPQKVVAPPMVYISGEEMTKYASDLIVEKWINPYFETNKWETFDLSCASRDQTDDQVLKDAVEAGKRIGAIFKEPTITPSAKQVRTNKELNGEYINFEI